MNLRPPTPVPPQLPRLAVLALVAWAAGCAPAPTEPPPPDVGPVTWHKDLEPVVASRCGGCHQAGGIAPFALDTFAAAKPLAGAMASATAARRMPPWMPAADCNRYRDDRSLSAREIELFQAWAEQGALEGEPGSGPSAPPSEAGLSSVDAELTADAYLPSTTEPDDFHCFVVDPQLAAAKNLVAYEFVPGAKSMVHHVLIYAVPRATAVAHDQADPGPGFACSTGSSAPDGPLVGGWVPGTRAVYFPSGTGLPVGPGDALVMEMHYNLANGAQLDQSKLQLQFATSPVKQARMLGFSDTQFSVPPHAMGFTPPNYPKTQTVQAAGKLWGVLPHMHRRGQKFRYEIRDGSTDTCVLAIDRWEYSWQEMFMLAEPISVPKGASVRLSCTWDNELDKPVVWGEGTDSEMCVSFAYVTVD